MKAIQKLFFCRVWPDKTFLFKVWKTPLLVPIRHVATERSGKGYPCTTFIDSMYFLFETFLLTTIFSRNERLLGH